MTARTRRTLQIIGRGRHRARRSARARAPSWPVKKTTSSARSTPSAVSVADLERLDELKATGDEITLLRSWLDEAWSLRSKHEYDQVREVLERTRKQADLIRAKITASKLRAQAQKREAALAELRAKIARTKKALADTAKKKKALEGSAGANNAGEDAGGPRPRDRREAPAKHRCRAGRRPGSAP